MGIAGGIIIVIIGICYIGLKAHEEMPGTITFIGQLWLIFLTPIIIVNLLLNDDLPYDQAFIMGIIALIIGIAYCVALFALAIYPDIITLLFGTPAEKKRLRKREATDEFIKQIRSMQHPQGDDLKAFRASLGPVFAKYNDRELRLHWRYLKLCEMQEKWEEEYDKMIADQEAQREAKRNKRKATVARIQRLFVYRDNGDQMK